MAMTTIEELFEHELKDIYGGEQRLAEGLEEMANESADRDIKRAFVQHRKETQGQIKRLERVFKSLGQKPEAETCAGIEGLVKEKKLFARERPTEELVDFFNVGAAQKVERYEITAYENLIDMAEKLGMREAVELLEANLEEEEQTLNKLKALASECDVTDIVGEQAQVVMEEEEQVVVTPARTRR